MLVWLLKKTATCICKVFQENQVWSRALLLTIEIEKTKHNGNEYLKFILFNLFIYQQLVSIPDLVGCSKYTKMKRTVPKQPD